ncbi:MAG: SAF domain-containing protein [Bifidobacterium sp.]
MNGDLFHDLSQRLQGTDGKHTNRAPSSAPHRRRRNAQLHRLLASLCAGLAIFAALQCVRLTISTQSVVIAAKSIAKGGVISADSLALRDIPYDEALRSVAHDIDDAVGLIAQVDIAEGSIVTRPWLALPRCSQRIYGGRSSVGEFRRQSDDWRYGDAFQRHDVQRGHAGNGTGYGCGVVT